MPPAMQKGFFASGPGVGNGGSAKKQAKAARKEAKANGAAEVFSMPGISAKDSSARNNSNKYNLDYSRFDNLGVREHKKTENEKLMRQLPPGLAERLGPSGLEMAKEMAAKMQDNPEMMPKPEEMAKQMQAELKAERVRQKQKNRGSAYKTTGNRATEPQAAVSASGSPSGGIDGTRAQLERQMKDMEEQANKMKEQQAALEKMTETGNVEDFAAFLMGQGLSEEQVKHMIERPGDASGLELLKKTLDTTLGAGPEDVPLDAVVTAELEKVDDMASKIKALTELDSNAAVDAAEEGDGVEDIYTDGAAQYKAVDRKSRGKESKAARKMRQELEAMQAQVAGARQAAEEQQVAVDKQMAAVEASRRSLEEAQQKKAEAGEAIDQEAKVLAEEVENEEEAKQQAEAVENAAYEADLAQRKADFAAGQASPVSSAPWPEPPVAPAPVAPEPPVGPAPPAHKLTRLVAEEGVRGEVFRWTVELPLVGSFKEVELELTDTAIRLTSTAYGAAEVELPVAIDPGGVKAKFLKKARQLRVDLPIA